MTLHFRTAFRIRNDIGGSELDGGSGEIWKRTLGDSTAQSCLWRLAMPTRVGVGVHGIPVLSSDGLV